MADCLDGIGYIEGEYIRSEAVKDAANVRRIAAVAIAIDNAARLIDNYRMQRDIANRQMRIAEEQQRHLQDTYWPRELTFLGEFGTPEDIEDANVLGRRYAGRLVASVAGAFAQQIKQADCRASRYCTSDRSKMMQDLLLVRAQTIANARVQGRMIGFSEVQARRDRNDARRRQAVALGKNLIGEAASLYGSAGAGLASVGKELSASLGSALTAFGYASRDPGRSQEMENMLSQNEFARAPYDPGGSISNGGRQIQYESIDDFLMQDPNAASQSVIGGASGMANTNPTSVWQGQQMERWNEGDVGNRDLARTGSVTYDFTDSDGDRGSITVNMSDFQLQYVDDKNPGDT